MGQPHTIRFRVPGLPVAQPRQRHRVVKTGKGRVFATNYTPRNDPVNAYKAAVRVTASTVWTGDPITGPVAVRLVFLFPRPGRLIWKKRPMPRCPHTGRPDTENIVKSTLDSLTGQLWVDDAQVCRLEASKWYIASGEAVGTEVEITVLNDDAT